MKSSLLILPIAFALLATTAHGESGGDEESLKRFIGVIQECAKSFPNIPDERERLLLRHETLPENRDERCVSGCVLKHSGMLTDSKINVEGWREWNNSKWNDKQMADKATEGAEYCKDKVTDEDSCDLAAKAMECIFTRNKEMGVSPPDIPE